MYYNKLKYNILYRIWISYLVYSLQNNQSMQSILIGLQSVSRTGKPTINAYCQLPFNFAFHLLSLLLPHTPIVYNLHSSLCS